MSSNAEEEDGGDSRGQGIGTTNALGYELRLHFETSVTEAIQMSLSQFRPLCIYLIDNKEEEGHNYGDNRFDYKQWELIHLPNKVANTEDNKCQLSMDSQNFLITKTINLKLVKDSNDFRFFIQAFPQFTMQFPSLYFLHGGNVLDCLLPHVEIEEFDSRIQDVIKKVGTIEQQQRLQTPTSTPTTTSGSASVVTPASTPAQESPRAHSQSSGSAPSASPVASTTPSLESTPHPAQVSTNSVSSRQPSQPPQTKKPKPYKSLKEESAEVAAQKYRENLIKQNKKDKEEKQRILRLLKADQAERRSKAKEEHIEEELESGNDVKHIKEEIHENLHNSKIDNSAEYLIQIKLFDGASVKCKMSHEKALKDVREYINSIHKEYSNFNYLFYKPVDRTTYSIEMEESTLIDLHLNRATLILKPIDPETSDLKNKGTSTATSFDNQDGGLGWFKSKVGGLFGWGSSARPSANSLGHMTSNGNIEDLNANDENHLNDSKPQSPRLQSSGGLESEFEYDFYTPRSPGSLISRNSSPIRPTLANSNHDIGLHSGMEMNFSSNNFNIPLSSGELQGEAIPSLSHVSSLTDIHHPRPQSVGNNGKRVLKTPPSLTASSTRIRTMVDDWSGESEDHQIQDENDDKKKDERRVYNGNFTSLEDDKKKSNHKKKATITRDEANDNKEENEL